MRHFLTLRDLDSDELRQLVARAGELKRLLQDGVDHACLPHKTLAMVFEKSSTRTRVSFESGMTQLGGQAIFLSSHDTQLGRGEPIEDTARVLSRMVDMIMIRTFAHEKLESFAACSEVPVINGLTDTYHPCQLLADLQTFTEHRGDIQGKTVAWVGDGNNMCHSWINAAALMQFRLRIACPAGYEPAADILSQAASQVEMSHDARQAVQDADLVTTDVWVSMGQEEDRQDRLQAFNAYQINAELMRQARSNALFMHCLPAHRGEEVTAEVLDNVNSVVWDEAGNRLHAQKALLEFLFSVNR